MKNDVTIFQLQTASSENQEYALLSLSDKSDKLIEDYGAAETTEKNYLRNTLHTYHGDTLYGEKGNLAFLDK